MKTNKVRTNNQIQRCMHILMILNPGERTVAEILKEMGDLNWSCNSKTYRRDMRTLLLAGLVEPTGESVEDRLPRLNEKFRSLVKLRMKVKVNHEQG